MGTLTSSNTNSVHTWTFPILLYKPYATATPRHSNPSHLENYFRVAVMAPNLRRASLYGVTEFFLHSNTIKLIPLSEFIKHSYPILGVAQIATARYRQSKRVTILVRAKVSYNDYRLSNLHNTIPSFMLVAEHRSQISAAMDLIDTRYITRCRFNYSLGSQSPHPVVLAFISVHLYPTGWLCMNEDLKTDPAEEIGHINKIAVKSCSQSRTIMKILPSPAFLGHSLKMIFSTHNVAFTFSLLMLASTSLGNRLSLCTKWSVRFGWLVATCPNDANPPIQVESSLLLNQIVSVNKQSQFIVRNSFPFSKLLYSPRFKLNTDLVESKVRSAISATDSAGREQVNALGVENGILFGDCVVAGGNHTTIRTTLDLATHIDNYNGFLISNFTKTPMVPAASSNVPVPLFFQIGFYLERTNCSSPFQPQDFSAPVKCKPVETLNDTGVENRGWSIALNDGYELSLWSTNDCLGEPLAKLGMKDTRKFCQVLPSRVNSISLRPLFNADYDLSMAFGNPLHRGERTFVAAWKVLEIKGDQWYARANACMWVLMEASKNTPQRTTLTLNSGWWVNMMQLSSFAPSHSETPVMYGFEQGGIDKVVNDTMNRTIDGMTKTAKWLNRSRTSTITP
ncbi:uncharacterized protein BDR25DRAFT_390425 [Lindgomyces ingoldianus]|uniref:Uncharacterized protein n=1 Tax=Lindgomyces ingoldianus TaxID=673940 RepID=A0ACB6RFR7_9PLEO|nr:uncharacterized protein BDR25DRAFT_390425 [Lindgomyces ingoldianus]KAF2478104.1 hypothetical protein BDR25DRAFT_390425 [Lindgomyces ingoldianus]